MQCKEIQIKVSGGDMLKAGEIAHLSQCQECSSFAGFNQGLATAVAEWRGEMPSDTLELRIQNQMTVAPPVRKGFSFRLIAPAGALAAVIAAALLLGGRENAEAAYRKMIHQIGEVTSAHFVLYWRPGNGGVENGKMEKVEELWWKPGYLRETASPQLGGDRLIVQTDQGAMFNRVDPATHQLATMKEGAAQMNRFSVDELSSMYMNNPAFYDSKEINSRTELITVTDKEGYSRIEFYVNPETHLPYSGTKEYLAGNQWQSSGRFEIQFNAPIPAGKFNVRDLR